LHEALHPDPFDGVGVTVRSPGVRAG
jgi:hypothetical protein